MCRRARGNLVHGVVLVVSVRPFFFCFLLSFLIFYAGVLVVLFHS